VRLTAAGKFLYEKLQDLPERMENLFSQAAAIARRENSLLSIGILEGQEVRPQLLYRLELAKKLHPGLELELERNSFLNLRNGLRTGHYDLIVTLDFDVEQEKEFEARTMFDQAPAIAINRRNPLADLEQLDMTRLKNEDFVVISPEESAAGYERFIRECQRTGFTPHIVRQPRTLESLILCVEMGVGVALLDQYTRLMHGDLVRIVPIPGRDMLVVAAYMKDDYRPLLRNVADLLVEGPGQSVGGNRV
jgi:DNA-binding transcriptional LysR family regulator